MGGFGKATDEVCGFSPSKSQVLLQSPPDRPNRLNEIWRIARIGPKNQASSSIVCSIGIKFAFSLPMTDVRQMKEPT